MTVEQWLGKENQLGIDIWKKKYQYDGETFDEWVERVSGGDKEVSKLIKEKKFLFGGRILANRGLQDRGKKVSFSNCYVITPPEDSIESIFDSLYKMARTYSYGGGCGTDLSGLAPRGAKVNNAAETTSGAVSFMDLYSTVTGSIGQSGRRGALMLSLSSEHPDLEEFVDLKTDLSRVTKANTSVRVSDEFMEKALAGLEHKLSFTREATGEVIEKTVSAPDVFRRIAENNWDYAEPGMLFWDKIKSWSLLSNNDEFEFAGVNPCAEEPLPAGGSCLLGSINVDAYVKDDMTFDYDAFKKDTKKCVVALNNVLDEGLPLHPLEEQRESVKNWRQIGLGVFGYADALIHMGIRYGSKDALKFTEAFMHAMINSAAMSSAELSKKDGFYPKYNESVLSTEFAKFTLEPEVRDFIKKSGLRNSQLLTCPPTGTTSTMIGKSNGIEPIYANYFTRKTESLHGKDVTYKVYTPVVKEYMEKNGIEDDADLPEFFVTAQTLDYVERINVQAAFQKYIDASISSTVNIPKETTVEEVLDLYMRAYLAGLKGITVFRDGCKRAGILIPDAEDEGVTELPRGAIREVPSDLTYRKYKIKSGCGRMYFFVGVDEAEGKIYDVFTNTDGVGGCTVNTQANSRLISACIRGGVPIEYVIEQLEKSGTCPSYQYARGKGKQLSPGRSCPSAIAVILKDLMKELQEDDIEPEDTPEDYGDEYDDSKGNKCPECGEYSVAMDGGCMTCRNCGWGKCS